MAARINFGGDLGGEGMENFRKMFGPGQLDQLIPQALQTCWLSLPPGQRSVAEVVNQSRRIFERAVKSLEEDGNAFFGSKPE